MHGMDGWMDRYDDHNLEPSTNTVGFAYIMYVAVKRCSFMTRMNERTDELFIFLLGNGTCMHATASSLLGWRGPANCSEGSATNERTESEFRRRITSARTYAWIRDLTTLHFGDDSTAMIDLCLGSGTYSESLLVILPPPTSR